MGIFNIDNKFFRALNKLVDMVILSFCWIISCIPVFTIGAASTALYDTSRRVIHHDEGYVWRGYWHAFKVNFKQATKAWLVQLIILIVLLGDIYITWSGLKTGNKWGAFSIVFIIMALIAAAWAIYTSAYISRFEQVTKITLKNTILILIANLPWTLLVIVILVVSLIIYGFLFHSFSYFLSAQHSPMSLFLSVFSESSCLRRTGSARRRRIRSTGISIIKDNHNNA